MKKKIASCLCVALLCGLTVGSVSYASGNRASQIKSHGVLLYESADEESNDEVYITVEDMKYLASDIDRLSDLIDGLQLKNNPRIRYIYHVHTGTPYVTGGCYRAWHDHADCPYHMADNDYTEPCDCTSNVATGGPEGYESRHCLHCGHDVHSGTCGMPVVGQHIERDCDDSVNNRWEYVCGKTTSTIDSAIIVFD